MDTKTRVSTESQPWRRKFSCCSGRDSNSEPFNHESGALTTELSLPPGEYESMSDSDIWEHVQVHMKVCLNAYRYMSKCIWEYA